MEKLTITHEAAVGADAWKVTLKGALDVFSYMEVKDYFSKIQGESSKNILLDLSAVDYVGSSGWSVLFVQATLLEKAGKLLVLCGMTDRVSHALDMIMPKKRLLETSKDVAEGVTALKSRVSTPAVSAG